MIQSFFFKKCFVTTVFLTLLTTAFSQNYYYKGTGNINSTANWGPNTDGSGTAPSNFTANNRTYNIRNTSAVTMNGAWTVSGTSSKIVIGDGTNACNFTVGSNLVLNATVDVSANATLTLSTTGSINNITLGTLAATSTVDFASTAAQTIPNDTYGNITISGSKGANDVTFGAGVTIAGDLTITATGTSGSGFVYFNTGNTDRNFTISGDYIQTGNIDVEFGSGNGHSFIDLGGNFSKTNGNMITNGNTENGRFTMTGASVTMQSNGGTEIKWIDFIISSNSVCTLNGQFNYAGSAGTNAVFTVNSGGTLNCGSFNVVSSGNAQFINNGTLGIGSSAGITSSGATGNIQTATRTFNTTGTYVYNGTTQVTGNGLPTTAITGGVTISNGATVTTTNAIIVNTPGVLAVNGTLTPGAATQVMSGTGTLNGSGTVQVNRTAATADFLSQYTQTTKTLTSLTVEYTVTTGSQVVSSTTYNNLKLNNTSGTNTTGGAVTVNGTLTTTAGGTLNMGTNQLLGTLSTISNSGTIQTQNTTSTPIPTGKTWGGTVQYNTTAGGQTVVTGTYNNLTLSNTSNTQTAGGALTVNGTLTTTAGGTLNMGTNQLLGTLSTITNGGTIQTQNTTSTPIPTGKTWGGTVQYNTTAGGQTVVNGTYNNLTLSNTSNTQTAGGALTVNGTLTTTAGGMLNMGTNQLIGTLSTITNGGTIQTQNTTATPVPTGKTWSGTVEYNATAGGQTVVTGTYNNLTVSNTSNTQTAGGAVTVNGTLTTTAGGTLNMGTNQLLGTLSTITNGGTIQTQNTTATPVPTGKTWGGTVQYNTTAGGQTVVTGTYNNLTLSNTSNTQTAGGALTVNGTLTTTAGGTLNMGTNQLLGTLSTITNGGTIQTQNTTATPVPTGKTWGGTVEYNTTAGGQTIVAGTYNNLKSSNTSGTQTLAGSIAVNGTMTLATGGATSIGSNTLTLNGAVSGAGTFTGSNTSNVTIGGTAGTLNFTSGGTNNFLKALTINNGASATLGNALNITAYDGTSSEGVLTVTGTGVLTTGGFLTLKSNANGTARIAPGNTAGGYISGAATVERFIPQNSSKSWRLLASTTSGQTINAAWQEGVVGGMNNPNAGFGTKIAAGRAITTSLATAQAAGFDTLSTGVSLFKYNPATDQLDVVTATNTGNIANEQGYFLFIRGDRSPGQFGAGAPTTSTVLRSKGTLFLGDQAPVATGAFNYGLVRNPYPSRIDMRNIVRGTNLVDAFQVWDSKLGGTFGVGGFQTFSKSGANYVVSPGGGSYGTIGSVNNFIESGAAFFIQSVGSTNNTAQVTEACKVSASSNNSYRPSGTLAEDKRISFTLSALNPGSTDIVDGGLVFFNDIYSNDVTVEDVRKSGNFNENFGILRNGTELVVEKRKDVALRDTIPFKMYQLRNISYKLDFEGLNFDPSVTGATLIDKFTNTNTALNLTGATSYTFTVSTTAGSFATDRFKIVLTSGNIFTGTGNWTDNARWSKGTPPVSGEHVFIESGANATLNTDFTVAGSLMMTPTSTLVVNPAKTLTISGTADFAGQSVTFKSDATGYGSLGQVTGTLSGATNVTVERYVPNNAFRSWRLLSVPTFGNGQTIRQAWQEGNANPVALQNNLPGYGTQITGAFTTQAAATAAGFDSTSVQASILTWNGNGWSNVTSTNQSIANNKAYFLFVRGERSKGVTGAVTNSSATTLRTNGTVYTGNQVFNIPTGSFSVASNLYPSAINFTGLTRNNVNNLFYIWDSKKQNGNSLGVYQTFSSTNGFLCLISGGSYTLGQPNTTIESGQAFFVTGGNNPGGGTLTLVESAKINGTNGNLGFRPSATPSKIDTRLLDANNEVLDANAVVFDPAYTAAIDGEDAVKFGNPGANFGIESNSKILAIEGTRPVKENDAIQFRMWNMKQSDYKIEFEASRMNTAGLYAILEDSYLSERKEIDLNHTSSTAFSVNADPASYAANRFRLVFSKTKVADVQLVKGFSISPNPVTGNTVNLILGDQPAGEYAVKITRLDGAVILSKAIMHNGGNSTKQLLLPAGTATGTYQVEIVTPGKTRIARQLVVAK